MFRPGQTGASNVCFLKKTKSLILAGLAISALAMTMNPAHANTVVWEFNLPSTGDPSVDPPYPSVARLTLEDTVDGVKFTLDPNEANPGYGSNSTVDALNIVFSGAADLPSSAYHWISGPLADATSFSNTNVAVVPPPASAANMDSGYTSDAGQLKLTWGNPDFNVTDISMWTITGTTIAANFSSMSNANNKPSPTFGIFSVSPISQFPDGPVPNPSNWVTGPGEVPVPAAVWLFGSGLLGMIGIGRRGKSG